MAIKCSIFKCANKAQTYIYLKAGQDQADLPEGLLSMLGELTQFLNLELDESSKLAQAKPKDVIRDLNAQGFYLQMPLGDDLKSQMPSHNYIQ